MATHIKEGETGRRIQAAMKYRGVSFEALAAATGIPVRTLYHYAAGGTEPPRQKLESIADALQVGPAQLVGWDPLTLELVGLQPSVPIVSDPVKRKLLRERQPRPLAA